MPRTAPSYPSFELSEKQRELRQEIRSYIAEDVESIDVNEYEWRDDPRERVPWEVIDAGVERGFKDLTVPEEFGGMDATPLTLTMAAEEMAAGEMGITVVFDQIWKIARIIDKMADDDVREEFFEEFVNDPAHILAVTFTEPANGTDDVTDYEEMQFNTTAEKDGDEWVINGLKHYTSNGADAKTYVVFAQTDPDVSASEGTTAFLVPRGADGLEVTHVWEKISQRLVNNATVEFDSVRVHEDYVLGDVHRGKARTAEVLKESAIEAGAIAIGTARRSFEDAFAYGNERVQGGQEIIDHQHIGQDFAEMAAELNAARSFLWSAARAIEEQGEDYRYELGAMGKYHACETAFDVSKRALEKFGGYGIMMENERPMHKYLRDTLSYLHSDGTSTAHKENAIEDLKQAYRNGGWEPYGRE